ncbi:hypothetical protein MX983_004858, partial [Escherichia coli]|nr:hypothetical protein [Escherichia coli]
DDKFITTDYLQQCLVGFAQCYLFDAQDIVTFGVTYLEKHFGTTPIVPPHEAVERSCEPSG